MKRDQPNTHKVNLNNVPFEYPLVDHFNSLIGKNVEFTLNYEHMPVVGPILKVIYYKKEKYSSRKFNITKSYKEPI